MIAPRVRGIPTKSNQFDETVLVGACDPGLPPFLNLIFKRLLKFGNFLTFSHEEYARKLPYRVSPHQLRHSGPSHDKCDGHRDLSEIQARSLWRQLACVRI